MGERDKFTNTCHAGRQWLSMMGNTRVGGFWLKMSCTSTLCTYQFVSNRTGVGLRLEAFHIMGARLILSCDREDTQIGVKPLPQQLLIFFFDQERFLLTISWNLIRLGMYIICRLRPLYLQTLILLSTVGINLN